MSQNLRLGLVGDRTAIGHLLIRGVGAGPKTRIDFAPRATTIPVTSPPSRVSTRTAAVLRVDVPATARGPAGGGRAVEMVPTASFVGKAHPGRDRSPPPAPRPCGTGRTPRRGNIARPREQAASVEVDGPRGPARRRPSDARTAAPRPPARGVRGAPSGGTSASRLDHHEHPVHARPVARQRACERILPRPRGAPEREPPRLPRLDEPQGLQDLRTPRDEAPQPSHRRRRPSAPPLSPPPLTRPRGACHHEVVRHDVPVLHHQHHRLPHLDDMDPRTRSNTIRFGTVRITTSAGGPPAPARRPGPPPMPKSSWNARMIYETHPRPEGSNHAGLPSRNAAPDPIFLLYGPYVPA